jgi:hypothetical protein
MRLEELRELKYSMASYEMLRAMLWMICINSAKPSGRTKSWGLLSFQQKLLPEAENNVTGE